MGRYSDSVHRHGIHNDAFEMDPPKSPWRYPQFLHTPRFSHSKAMKSVSFRGDVGKPQLSVPGFQNFKRTDSQDSTSSSDSNVSSGPVELHVPKFTKFKEQMEIEDRRRSKDDRGRGKEERSRSKGAKRSSDTSVISGTCSLGAVTEEDGVISRENSHKSTEHAAPSDASPGASFETAASSADSDNRKISQESDSILYRSRGHPNLSRRFSAEPVKIVDESNGAW